MKGECDKLNRLKNLSKDFLYSMLGIVAMNAVLQLVVYPFLTKKMGTEAFGDVLSLISLIAIMGGTFGTAANYSRMILRVKNKDTNGDYNRFFVYVAFITMLVSTGGLLWLHITDIRVYIGYYVLMFVTIIRNYGDVDFRLEMNYKGYCLYYVLLSVGYLLGVVSFYLSGSWILTLLFGEWMAVLYVCARKKIFSSPLLKKSLYYGDAMKSILPLAITQLIAMAVLHSDRLILQQFCNGTAVTVFYVATLLGKIISLVSTPLNSVIIGHLSQYKGGIDKKIFRRLCLYSVPLAILINMICTLVAVVFVKIIYPELYGAVSPYLWLANLGQVFFFVSGVLTVVLMRFASEKYQLIINVVYFVIYLCLAIPFTIQWNVWGIAWATVIGNLLRILLIGILGEVGIRKSI